VSSRRTLRCWAALGLGIALMGGCDATRLDHQTCWQDEGNCNQGFTCDKLTHQCVPALDGGTADSPDAPLPDGSVAFDLRVDRGTDTATDAPLAPALDSAGEAGPAFDGASAAIDVAVDGRAIDAAGTCGSDGDCLSRDARFCVQGLCVACKTSAECRGGSPVCSSAHACVSCAAAPAGCPSAAPACEADSGQCFECLADRDCTGKPGKSFCRSGTCVPCSAADASACAARDPAKPVCLASGACGECASSADCTATSKPICDTSASACVACTSDGQCQIKGGGSGVCLADGHCASSAETAYVGRTALGSCSDTVVNAGSLAEPFCTTTKAIAAGKPVVIVLNNLADSFALGALGAPLVIVGRGAVVTARADTDGISLNAGDLSLRGLTITGNPSSNQGVGIDIQATTPRSATLHLDGCTISKHADGGIFLANAAFDIRNSTIVNNGSGQTGDGNVWSGVRIDKLPASGPTMLNLVTISNNASVGLSCAAAIQGLGVLSTGNATDITSSCGFSPCAAAGTSCGSQL
jgi:hypothetical protein